MVKAKNTKDIASEVQKRQKQVAKLAANSALQAQLAPYKQKLFSELSAGDKDFLLHALFTRARLIMD